LSCSFLSKNLKVKISGNLILAVGLYESETWFLILRDNRRLRVFENRVLRRIFGPRWDEVTKECRKLHDEQLNYLCSSPRIVWVIISRRMRLAGHVAHMGERVFVEKPEGKRSLG